MADRETDLERLDDIVDAIASIRSNVPDRLIFDSSEPVRSHTVLKLQVIGEAANRLSPQLRDAHGEVPWRQIIGLRHRIVHDYGQIAPDLVWSIVENELLELERNVSAIIANLRGSDHG